VAENKFYTYAFLDPRKPGRFVYGDYKFDYEPFYIGKGMGSRCYSPQRGYNSYLMNKINKISMEADGHIIETVIENVFEEDAFICEIKLIELIGRIDKKKGPLVNLTDGGEGSYGISDEQKELRSKMFSGKNNPFYGKKHSKETIKKIKDSRKKTQSAEGYINPKVGTKIPEETRLKICSSLQKKYSDPDYIHFNLGKKRSKEIRLKLSACKSGDKNPNYGKKQSKEHITKRVASVKKTTSLVGYVNPNIGRTMSDESKLKISESHKGKKQSKEHIENNISARKRNRDKKVEELYQSIINLIIRKEQVQCGLL